MARDGPAEPWRIGLVGIALALDLKFGAESQQVISEPGQITELTVIQAVYDAIKTAHTLDDLRQVYVPPPT